MVRYASARKILGRAQDLTASPRRITSGDLFGDKHAFSAESGVFTITEAALRQQLAGVVIEAFDIEDGLRPSGGELTRWHAFGIAVSVPTV